MSEQEKNELRQYLRQQISKIKQILSLKKLKIICVLKKILYKLVGGVNEYIKRVLPPTHCNLDFQISFYQIVIGNLI